MLDKIRKLMALALNNPSEEEARSAALKAVRLISEHKAVISLPANEPQYSAQYSDIFGAVLSQMRRTQQSYTDAAWDSPFRRAAAAQTGTHDENGNPWK